MRRNVNGRRGPMGETPFERYCIRALEELERAAERADRRWEAQLRYWEEEKRERAEARREWERWRQEGNEDRARFAELTQLTIESLKAVHKGLTGIVDELKTIRRGRSNGKN